MSKRPTRCDPNRPAAAAGERRSTGGFTLTELLVVVGLIALTLAIVLPSMVNMFSAGSERQGRVMVSGMMGAARSLAANYQTYALVHIQVGVDERCWMGIMRYDNTSHTFVSEPGYRPQAVPGGMCVGEVAFSSSSTTPTVDDTGNFLDVGGVVNAPPGPNFTTVNIVFSPDGSLVSQVPNAAGALAAPVIDTTGLAFAGNADQKVWEPAGCVDKNGARLLTVFDYKIVRARKAGAAGAAGSKGDYLQKNAVFLCVNPYTGQLMPTR